MHTPRCNHASGSVLDYAQSALAQGMREIGISDHAPMPAGYDPEWRMRREELADYCSEVEQVAGQLRSELTIRLALEADFYPGAEPWLRELSAAHDWDYWIGSVHYVGDWGFDNPDLLHQWHGREIEQAYCDYFALVAASAESRLFEIIGHPDLIKKFGHRPPAGSRKVAQAEMAMLEAVRDAGCALEISSAGLRKPVGEIYPHARIIAEAAKLGIPFAYGSDAHAPQEVGHAMHSCQTLLAACGVRDVASFCQRQRNMLPIVAF